MGAPWTGEYTWPATDEQMYEYACHEGNYALENILRGARRREARRGEAVSGLAGHRRDAMKQLCSLRTAAIVLAAALPVRAHHAFGGEFDANRPVLLKGRSSRSSG